MIIKTKIINIEIEWLLILVILVTLLSPKIARLIDVFYMCYFFIFFHELSHIFVASILGKRAEKIKFSLAGVCVFFENSYYGQGKLNKIRDILIYLAGPLSNVILAVIFRNNEIIFSINIFLAVLNCMPIEPLDGYNICLKIFSFFTSPKRVRIILKIVSNILICLVILLAIYQIIYYKMASLLIFAIYLYLLENTRKYDINYDKILHQMTG